MVNWNTRLGIKFIKTNGQESTITPIDSFSPKIETPHDIIDSVEGENIGFSAKNRRFSFDFTVKSANVAVMREMYAAAINKNGFDIGMVNVHSDTHNEWVWDTVKFKDCRFTNVSPSDVTNDGGIPSMTFSGICRNVVATKLGSTTVDTGN